MRPAPSRSIETHSTPMKSCASTVLTAGSRTPRFHGDRVGTLADPYGHVWAIGTHREDVSVEEMQRRMASMASQKTAG